MNVQLSAEGLYHYPRRGNSRKNKIGKVINRLPSGCYTVEWPWGIAINYPRELNLLGTVSND